MSLRMTGFVWMGLLFMAVPGTFAGEVRTAIAAVERVTDYHEAVGTIRPRTESSIEAQVMAQVLDVKVRPGDRVKKGQVLAALDNRQLASRHSQAKEGLNRAVAAKKEALQGEAAAQAAFREAETNFNRIRKYFQSRTATSQQLEAAESAYLQARAALNRSKESRIAAEAGIRQAEEVVREADILLRYALVASPEDGEVLRRLVEPGDTAVPGRPLFILQTAAQLRMEAYVREGLILRVAPGTRLSADIGTLGETLDTVVEEIVPYADPQSRTFLVKVSLPPLPGLYPGMFGRLRIPVAEHEAVVIPEAALRRVGQLELVSVHEKGAWRHRYIRSGNRFGARIEVLSGLSAGETVRLWGEP